MSLTVAPSETTDDLIAALGADNEALARILAVATLLVDSVPLRRRDQVIGTAEQIDVLVPFAGS